MHIAAMADLGMAKRLKQARERDGSYKEATEAARALGAGVSTYLAHENGTRGFRAWAPKYARFYKVNLVWLLEGIGEPRGKSTEARFIDLTTEEQVELDRFAEFLRTRRQH